MHFTRHTDYALRLLLHLASSPEQWGIVADIAAIHGISRNHLMKVVQQLGHGGFLMTRRGRGGGLTLARPADEITIGEVVRFTEPDMSLANCADCRIAPACGLTGILAEAKASLLSTLDRYTLTEARGEGAALKELVAKLRPQPG